MKEQKKFYHANINEMLMKAGVGVLTSENFRAQNTSKDKKVIF